MMPSMKKSRARSILFVAGFGLLGVIVKAYSRAPEAVVAGLVTCAVIAFGTWLVLFGIPNFLRKWGW